MSDLAAKMFGTIWEQVMAQSESCADTGDCQNYGDQPTVPPEHKEVSPEEAARIWEAVVASAQG